MIRPSTILNLARGTIPWREFGQFMKFSLHVTLRMILKHHTMMFAFLKSSVVIRPHERKKTAFSKISSLGRVSEKYHFRWSYSPDTCGRGLGLKGRLNIECLFRRNRKFYAMINFMQCSHIKSGCQKISWSRGQTWNFEFLHILSG